MLPDDKIHIDNRHRTATSKTKSGFDIQLKEPTNLPDNRMCGVSDIILKNTITTVEKFKAKVYVKFNGVANNLTMDNRNYTILYLGAHITNTTNLAFADPNMPNATGTPFDVVEDVLTRSS